MMPRTGWPRARVRRGGWSSAEARACTSALRSKEGVRQARRHNTAAAAATVAAAIVAASDVVVLIVAAVECF